MAFLKRAEILNISDVKTEIVAVPEWGGEVMVKAMTGRERDAYEASMLDEKGEAKNLKNLRAKLVALTVVDPETMKPIFTIGDIDTLGEKSAIALDRIFASAQRLSRITDTDVKELTKNS